MESSFNSTGLLLGVGPYWYPLVDVHTISIIIFHLQCMLRGGIWIRMKSNLFQFIEGQTHFSTIWHAKNDPRWTNLECSSFKPSQALKVLYANQPTPWKKVMLHEQITLILFEYLPLWGELWISIANCITNNSDIEIKKWYQGEDNSNYTRHKTITKREQNEL